VGIVGGVDGVESATAAPGFAAALMDGDGLASVPFGAGLSSPSDAPFCSPSEEASSSPPDREFLSASGAVPVDARLSSPPDRQFFTASGAAPSSPPDRESFSTSGTVSFEGVDAVETATAAPGCTAALMDRDGLASVPFSAGLSSPSDAPFCAPSDEACSSPPDREFFSASGAVPVGVRLSLPSDAPFCAPSDEACSSPPDREFFSASGAVPSGVRPSSPSDAPFRAPSDGVSFDGVDVVETASPAPESAAVVSASALPARAISSAHTPNMKRRTRKARRPERRLAVRRSSPEADDGMGPLAVTMPPFDSVSSVGVRARRVMWPMAGVWPRVIDGSLRCAD
jgi:hypothetical protein